MPQSICLLGHGDIMLIIIVAIVAFWIGQTSVPLPPKSLLVNTGVVLMVNTGEQLRVQ